MTDLATGPVRELVRLVPSSLREAALALGTRVAVASSRENDPNPVMWLAGQDYRAADATHPAHLELVRSRRGPERLGPER